MKDLDTPPRATPSNSASNDSFAKAVRSNGKHWTWFLGIFVFEFWLSDSIPPHILASYPPLKMFVDAVATIAPVVYNFDRIARYPEALSLFFAITTFLIIPKTAFFYIWLNSSRLSMYRHFVISPLTSTSPKNPGEFITEPLSQGKTPEEKPRSLVSRVGWSLLIVIVGASLVFTNLVSGWEIPKRPIEAIPQGLVDVAKGGLSLWFYWSLKWATFTALLLAIVASIARDYLAFFRNLIRFGDSRHE